MAEWAFFSSKPNKPKLNDLFYSLLLLGLATLGEGRRVWWSSSSGTADYMSYVLRQNCEFQVATPSQQDVTNCLSQDIVLLYFLWEILIFPLLVWFSLHVSSKYSCGGEFPDISVTMCYEDHIALWSFRIFSITWMSSISSAALQPSLLCSGGFPFSVGEILRKENDEQEEIPNWGKHWQTIMFAPNLWGTNLSGSSRL